MMELTCLSLRRISECAFMPKPIFTSLPSLIVFAALICLVVSISPAPAEASIVYGDVNKDGRIDVQDVVMVMRHILGKQALSEEQETAADVNFDGMINVQDVSLLMQKSLGLIDKFPNQPEPDLIAEFIVSDGVSLGKKFVLVSLTVDNPAQYRVKVGGTELDYNKELRAFYGEVTEADAVRDRVKVEKR